ncbi:putative dolichyldiphosphatase [Cryphonectria parasitica EP155]|uniref:Dolichyldiphosphatase n=1 Tax=Cryphonectria parasitica (strain ATCC 38755 / EP155) TaxID=660469 RepID=A0A9P4YD42_CRYP1|nr:putative dolichyldiphosphatase [Cryphonectria parasitica EP155]KAF3770860.1 putative dolichyldiphosphatase [Cryphonectria parasitica EP155]
MADDIPLASLSLTHVYYDPSDHISYLCAWLALVPQALCVVYVTLIWSTREAEVGLMFAGQLACEAVNFALKRIIKEERPERIHRTGKGYGMPSSHAQFVAFWAVAMVLFLLMRHTPSWTDHGYGPREQEQEQNGDGDDGDDDDGTAAGTRTRRRRRTNKSAWGADWVMVETYAHRPWSYTERAVASVFVLAVAAAVSWSRVYLGYHTVKQVLAGTLAGTLSAVAWYAVTHVVREVGLLSWALESPVARGLRVRDLVVSEDLSQAGWEKWEDRKLVAGQSWSSRKKK